MVPLLSEEICVERFWFGGDSVDLGISTTVGNPNGVRDSVDLGISTTVGNPNGVRDSVDLGISTNVSTAGVS